MRFNSFNLVHKALRALIYDTALALQQTYFADVKEAEDALARIDSVVYAFDRHAYHEDNFILPVIEIQEPALVAELEKEHVEDNKLGSQLHHLVTMFKSLEKAEERIQCGSAINVAFRAFMVFNLNHMAKEEVDINQALWKHYTDEQLMQLNERLVASIPPYDKAFTSKWMMRSINKAEAIAWLKSVKKTVPKEVFFSLLELTETELPERFRAEVQDEVMYYEMAV